MTDSAHQDRAARDLKRHARQTRRIANRERRINELVEMLGGKCSCCGDSRSSVLQFHHPEGVRKRFEIGQAVHRDVSWHLVVDEASMCELLCASCHAHETVLLREQARVEAEWSMLVASGLA